MATRKITLVRHGKHQRGVNIPNGGDLLPIGKEQAAYVGGALLRRNDITALYASTMQRAYTTAQIIATFFAHLGVTTTNDLREAVFHVPQSQQDQDPYETMAPGTIDAHRVRMAVAYSKYIRPADGPHDEHDVLVCHGNVIRYFMVRALNEPVASWHQYHVANASFTSLQVDDDGTVRLLDYSSVSHLPRRLRNV